jgi:hypothetical protein
VRGSKSQVIVDGGGEIGERCGAVRGCRVRVMRNHRWCRIRLSRISWHVIHGVGDALDTTRGSR